MTVLAFERNSVLVITGQLELLLVVDTGPTVLEFKTVVMDIVVFIL